MSVAMFESVDQLRRRRRRTGRRRFLIALAAGVGGYLGYRWWRARPMPLVERRHRYLTPNRDFYTVSIGGYPEKPDIEHWRLRLESPARSFEMSDAQIRALESKTIPKTFMCISNRVAGDAIGNAEWTVTPLAPLIRRVLPPQGGPWTVAFHALDGFYSSVPLEVALDEEAYLAYQMNGVPLPREHGYPLRVLLPGKYGMKQPRWLERIEVTDGSVSGYWEWRGWSSAADVKMTSRIDSASRQDGGTWLLRGIAYCGARAVGEVQWRVDGGVWQPTRLTNAALPNAWSTWESGWTPAGTGSHVLEVRVADEQGERQEEEFSGAFPSGATGLHRVIVEV